MPNDVKWKLNSAIERLIENDRYLLETDVNERSISHRLALYLQEAFPDWDVDCEYNRNLKNIKSLEVPTSNVSWDDTEAKTVYPDIIIHHRGIQENLLVIEIKKNNCSQFDRKKLYAFKHELKYQYAAELILTTGPNGGHIKKLEYTE